MTVEELKNLVRIADNLGIKDIYYLEHGRDGGKSVIKSIGNTKPFDIIMWEGVPTLVVKT